jgi:hypothetical protein
MQRSHAAIAQYQFRDLELAAASGFATKATSIKG